MVAFLRLASVALPLGLAVGCSTHLYPLTYAPGPELGPPVDTTARISVGRVEDGRGTDATWLGAIRGGYGNVLKTLRTDRPMRDVVADAFRDALRHRGLLAQLDLRHTTKSRF